MKSGVLADQEQRDRDRGVDLPRLNRMRCELVCKSENADREDSRPEQLIQDELGSLNGIPSFVKRRFDVSNQCPRPQSSQKRTKHLPNKVHLQLVMPVLDVHADRNRRIDVSACHFAC